MTKTYWLVVLPIAKQSAAQNKMAIIFPEGGSDTFTTKLQSLSNPGVATHVCLCWLNVESQTKKKIMKYFGLTGQGLISKIEQRLGGAVYHGKAASNIELIHLIKQNLIDNDLKLYP